MKDEFDLDIVMCTYNLPSKLIKGIDWTYTLCRTLDSDDKLYENISGITTLKIDPVPDPFIEFKDVTKDLCIKWVSDAEDLDALKVELTKILDARSNPTEALSLPWATSE